jgi:hypothetical protein
MSLRTKLPALVALAAVLLTPVTATAAPPIHAREVNLFTETDSGRRGAFAYNGEKYVYVAYTGRVFTSVDGLNWAMVEDRSADLPEARSMIWDGRQFVLVCLHRIYSSPDGIHWAPHEIQHPDPDKQYYFNDVLYAKGHYYVVGQPGPKDVSIIMALRGNAIFVSPDLTHWRQAVIRNIQADYLGEMALESLGYNGKNFIAGGPAMAFSDDGETWEGPGAGGRFLLWDGTRHLYTYSWVGGDEIWESTGTGVVNRVFKSKKLPLNLTFLGYARGEYLGVGASAD